MTLGIRDVSSQAGVSTATVSRVFNTPGKVSPDVRARVLAAALALGYRPDSSARSLRTRRSRTLGVMLPTLANPVFADCLQGIAEAAGARGYAIMPATTEYRTAQEAEAAERLLAQGVEGLILCVADAAASVVLAQLQRIGSPYVLAYNRHPAHPCVSVDGQAAVAALVARLQAMGHRRILMVSGEWAHSDRARQRHQGYLQGMQAAGLAPESLQVPFLGEGVVQIAARLQQRPAPSALVCSNDVLAIRCLRAARLLGLRVPQDLSVVGFDGITLGEDLSPALSTIVQPSAVIGRRCVELLVKALAADGRPAADDSLTLPLHFREGESLAATGTPRPRRPSRPVPPFPST